MLAIMHYRQKTEHNVMQLYEKNSNALLLWGKKALI